MFGQSRDLLWAFCACTKSTHTHNHSHVHKQTHYAPNVTVMCARNHTILSQIIIFWKLTKLNWTEECWREGSHQTLRKKKARKPKEFGSWLLIFKATPGAATNRWIPRPWTDAWMDSNCLAACVGKNCKSWKVNAKWIHTVLKPNKPGIEMQWAKSLPQTYRRKTLKDVSADYKDAVDTLTPLSKSSMAACRWRAASSSCSCLCFSVSCSSFSSSCTRLSS